MGAEIEVVLGRLFWNGQRAVEGRILSDYGERGVEVILPRRSRSGTCRPWPACGLRRQRTVRSAGGVCDAASSTRGRESRRERRPASRLEEFGEEPLAVAVQNGGVCDAAFGEPGGREVGVFASDLDAEEIVVWQAGRGGGEEQSLAAADFNLQRGLAAEQAAGVPRLRQLIPDQEVAGEVERGIGFS